MWPNIGYKLLLIVILSLETQQLLLGCLDSHLVHVLYTLNIDSIVPGVDMKQIRILFCDQYNHCLATNHVKWEVPKYNQLLSVTTEAAHSLA